MKMYQLFKNKWECAISIAHARGFDFSYLLPSFRLTEAPPLESHCLTQQEEGTQSIRHWCLNTSSVTFSHISLVRVSHMATSNFNGSWMVTIFYIRNLRKNVNSIYHSSNGGWYSATICYGLNYILPKINILKP